MTDAGFPKGTRQPRKGAPTYYLANFSQKLQENEEILGLDPPMHLKLEIALANTFYLTFLILLCCSLCNFGSQKPLKYSVRFKTRSIETFFEDDTTYVGTRFYLLNSQ